MKKLLFTLLLAAAVLPSWAEKYPSVLHVVGNATTAGWLDGTSTLLYQVSEKKYEGFVSFVGYGNGEMKILCQSGWSDHWGPTVAQTPLTEAGTLPLSFYQNGTPDNKFFPASIEGLYLVSVDLTTEGSETATFTQWTTSSVYEIGIANQLSAYADCINKFNQSVNAKLTADIDMTGVTGWTPIGQDGKDFKGQFDGQGHRIKNLTTTDGYNNQALFGQAVGGAIIENVIIDASCTIKGAKFTAGILGHVWGDGVIVRNCGNEADVTGTEANAAGIVGCSEKKVIIENCYNTGHITGSKESAAICGWMGDGSSTIANCYNIGAITGQDGSNRMYRRTVTATNLYDIDGVQGTKFTNEQLASGELCYNLNGNQSTIAWYQTLGTDGDAHPVPFSAGGHSRVYANGEMKCDGTAIPGGTLTYSNASTSDIPPHTFSDGWCTVCGTLDQNYLMTNSEGFYLIGNANDLKWFAGLVNTVNQAAKAKLTDDIDYTDHKQGWIGTSQGVPFKGTFDGQEHTIKIDIINTNLGRTGLFAYINAATIKNLVVEGSATSAGNNCVGGLGGRSDGNGTLIENVIVKTAVSYTGSNNDATCGGLFANMEGSVTLKNCAFLGSINTGTAEGNGGLVGWAGGGSNNQYINCLVAPVEYTKNGNSADFARNSPSTTNCHKVAANDATLASGELCYTLNAGGDNWYQNLDSDATPVPFSSHGKVYANASYYCDGTAKGAIVYANVDEEQHDPHQLVGGFCTVCNTMVSYVADYITPAADGYYEISDNKQMRWFAAMVKDYRNAHNLTENADCNAPVNARLMNDIDFTGVKDYAPIGGLWGQGNTRYAGTFDGQGYKIKNLVVDIEKNEIGVFGVISEGAVIKNITLDSSCSITGNAHVGFVGEVWHSQDGDVRLECLGNEASITGSGNNIGGILGVNMRNGSYAKLYMTNCYSTGAIKGNSENGQLTGWSGDGAVVENCYAIGETTNCDGFGRFPNGCTLTNNFCDKDLNWGPTKITDDMLASGELAYKLGAAFSQLIGTDTHPVFGNAPVSYVGDTGYATMYDTTTGYELNGDVKAYAAVLNNTWLDLSEIGVQVPADNAVVLKGTYYNKLAADLPAINVANDLKGTDVDTAADGTMYILANGADGVGFYKAEGTIPAGKAYFQSTSGVKAFFFDGDDATGISGVDANLNANDAIYNIAGQRVQKMQKGINIINGKKVLF